ncbi:MAG: RNA polymerase sigma factor [Acidobacteriia bacterium]|nr:RNA polymerase sigma factor [Terriglobia bacterium]
MTPVVAANEAGALFTAYHDRICRYIAGMVRDPAEAEDLTQETFLRAYCQQETLRDPKAARGWLYRIATHVCLDRLRKRGRQVALDGGEEAHHGQPAALEPSAQETVERAETSACVQRCLDYLPDSYRAVILLYEAHGLTAPEIAELLSVSVGTVKMRLHRARRRLQEVMEIGCTVSGKDSGVPCCESKK